MKLSHQSRRRDRMTQINKTESFGGSPRTLETPETTRAGIRPVRHPSDRRWKPWSLSSYQFLCLPPKVLQHGRDVFQAVLENSWKQLRRIGPKPNKRRQITPSLFQRRANCRYLLSEAPLLCWCRLTVWLIKLMLIQPACTARHYFSSLLSVRISYSYRTQCERRLRHCQRLWLSFVLI